MKKKTAPKKAKATSSLHRKLNQPVHEVVGYSVLLVLSVVTFFVVMTLTTR